MHINSGLPQGCVLSSLMFNFYTKSLHYPTSLTTIFQFADDFMILSSGLNNIFTIEVLKDAVDSFSSLAENSSLKFHPDKINFLVFKSRKQATSKIKRTTIMEKHSVKFLGRVIEKQLKTCHISLLKDKLKNISKPLKYLCSLKGGLSPSHSLLLYRSMVRSYIDTVGRTASFISEFNFK